MVTFLLAKEGKMPYKPGEREYRSFAATNFKPVEAELPDVADEERVSEPTYKVRGEFTTFNDPYLLYPAMPSLGMEAEYEQIDKHAFDHCDVNDVIVQFDHSGDVLARTRNGSLVLSFDEHGGKCEMYLGGCQRGRDLFESIQNGLVVDMSFGFIIADDEQGRGLTYDIDEDGTIHTTVTRISKLFDISVTSIPANPMTSVEEMRKRSYSYAVIEADRKAEEARIEQERIAAVQAEEQRMAEEAAERAEQERQIALLRLRAKAVLVSQI